MASKSTEINQTPSTKLSEEAKQKLLDLQTQLQQKMIGRKVLPHAAIIISDL
jgi:hypothetical protein